MHFCKVVVVLPPFIMSRGSLVEQATGARWMDIWGTSLWPDTPMTYLPPTLWTASTCFADTTIRQTLRVSLGADKIRIRISNQYGSDILPVTSVVAALPLAGREGNIAGSPDVLADSLKQVTFGGLEGVDIPPYATVLSDPIDLKVRPASDISISMYLANGQPGPIVTAHLTSKSETWFNPGDHTRSDKLTSTALSYPRWYYISAIEGLLDDGACSIACVGDSITDRGDSKLPMNRYDGWIDRLFDRLQDRPSTSDIAVLNFGISGDQVYRGGVGRIERDVLARNGVKFVFLLMGVNDIGMTSNTQEAQDQLFQRLVFSYQQIIQKVHTIGLPIFTSTIMPFTCPPGWPTPWDFVDPTREQTRLKINRWILSCKDFDYVVDWSKTLEDPSNPHMVQHQYQYGDYLHPSPEGYRAMAYDLDMKIFDKFRRLE